MTAADDNKQIEIPDSLPVAPISAFKPADWHEVPKGFYAIPIWDWMKFGDECGYPEDPTPVAELLGFHLFERKVPVVFKNGKRAGKQAGRDAFTAGHQVLAHGVTDYALWAGTKNETRYTPWERLRKECENDRFTAAHELRRDDDPEPRCCCPVYCAWPKNSDGHWKAVQNRREAYINCAAAVILDGIKNHGDIYRKLYGQLTGSCGICGRLLTDPTSKLLGIGPDCRGERRAA